MKITISRLDTTKPDGVVVTANWRATLVETVEGIAYETSMYGTCSFNRKNPSNPSFIPLTELSEQIVTNWIFEKCGESILNTLNNQISALRNTPSLDKLPWKSN